MATQPATPERATLRTVVLLRPSEKIKLERLASKEKLTTAEVIQRFIQHGDTIFRSREEEQVIEATLKLISTAAEEANASLIQTIEKVDKLHRELSKRDPA